MNRIYNKRQRTAELGKQVEGGTDKQTEHRAKGGLFLLVILVRLRLVVLQVVAPSLPSARLEVPVVVPPHVNGAVVLVQTAHALAPGQRAFLVLEIGLWACRWLRYRPSEQRGGGRGKGAHRVLAEHPWKVAHETNHPHTNASNHQILCSLRDHRCSPDRRQEERGTFDDVWESENLGI